MRGGGGGERFEGDDDETRFVSGGPIVVIEKDVYLFFFSMCHSNLTHYTHYPQCAAVRLMYHSHLPH